jgi:hypothetical protein
MTCWGEDLDELLIMINECMMRLNRAEVLLKPLIVIKLSDLDCEPMYTKALGAIASVAKIFHELAPGVDKQLTASGWRNPWVWDVHELLVELARGWKEIEVRGNLISHKAK